jgi:hypothetical protein
MKKPRKNPLRDRWIICGRSPKSGRLLCYTVNKTLATRGRSQKFASIEKAFERARKLLTEHPQLRAYNLFAEKLRAPGESGAVKTLKNPSGFSRARDNYVKEMDRAADTFEAFTGRAATHKTTHKIPTPKTGFALGPLVGVIYRASREDDGGTFEYLHRFRKSSQPLLIASDDGKQLVISGGEFQVTEKGIEDR